MHGEKYRPHRRLASALLPAVLFITLGGCADDIDEPVGAPLVDDVDDDLGPDPSLVGLEITASGNVTEVAAPIAFRMDKDGAGAEGEADADDLAEFDDEDFGDVEFVADGVLVIDVRETDVTEGATVEVTGTVRRFELAEAERLFDIELDEGVYGAFEQELVIVADRVVVAPSTGGSTTTTAG